MSDNSQYQEGIKLEGQETKEDPSDTNYEQEKDTIERGNDYYQGGIPGHC